MYNVVLNCSSEMLSMLLLTLAKGRQTDTSKRLLWVWCTSLQELPIHWGSFLQRHQWRKPCRKPSLGWFAWAFAQASFIGNLEAADICRHLQTVIFIWENCGATHEGQGHNIIDMFTYFYWHFNVSAMWYQVISSDIKWYLCKYLMGFHGIASINGWDMMIWCLLDPFEHHYL